MFGKSWKTVSPAGEVAAFICGDCGYFEQYVKNPEALEWDKLQDFRWCNEEDRPPGKKSV